MIKIEETPQYQDVPLPENREITAHISQIFPSKVGATNTCLWINQKGRNVGGECGKPTVDDNKWCSAHITIDLMNKKREKKDIPEKKQPTIIEEPELSDEEEFEEIQAPHPTPFMLPVNPQGNNKEERLLNILEGMMLILTQMKIR